MCDFFLFLKFPDREICRLLVSQKGYLSSSMARTLTLATKKFEKPGLLFPKPWLKNHEIAGKVFNHNLFGGHAY